MMTKQNYWIYLFIFETCWKTLYIKAVYSLGTAGHNMSRVFRSNCMNMASTVGLVAVLLYYAIALQVLFLNNLDFIKSMLKICTALTSISNFLSSKSIESSEILTFSRLIWLIGESFAGVTEGTQGFGSAQLCYRAETVNENHELTTVRGCLWLSIRWGYKSSGEVQLSQWRLSLFLFRGDHPTEHFFWLSLTHTVSTYDREF